LNEKKVEGKIDEGIDAWKKKIVPLFTFDPLAEIE